jgi:hypothetical protein
MLRLVLAFDGNSTNSDPKKVVYCGHSASVAQEKIDGYKGSDDLRVVEIPQLRRAKRTRPENVSNPADDREAARAAVELSQRRNAFIHEKVNAAREKNNGQESSRCAIRPGITGSRGAQTTLYR